MSAHRLESLAALRAHLARSRRVLQPLADANGGLHWQDAAANAPLPERAQLPQFSPKAMMFSEQEALFVFDGAVFRESRPAPLATVLLGVSACDLAAIHYQDRFFADDPWYQARRKAILLVGIDCTAPCAGGFCPLTDSGPFVRAGHADLVLHRLHDGTGNDDGWLLFVATDAGAQALEGMTLAHHAVARRPAFVAQHEPAVVAQFPDADPLRRGIDALNAGAVPSERWRRLGTECITCSGCSTVCPTCSCFATQQVPAAAAGTTSGPTETATVRFWDSCLYENFQREASGHNPTAAAGARIERFWTHKFGNDFVARFGHYTCVGCGRCDRVCPSGIGAKSTLARLGDANDVGAPI